MHLVIISGAARPRAKSNTAKVIYAFSKGFQENGGSTEVWYLSDRAQWEGAAKAFMQNDRILMAFPLYVESIPGVMLEFLSELSPKKTAGTKLAFIIQSGFPKPSQSRCCEAFLETLPAKLGCEYAGTLIKGDMFGLGLVDDKNREKMLAPFIGMGRAFAETGRFEKEQVQPSQAPSICRKSRYDRTTVWGSTSPDSTSAASPKSWAAGVSWTQDRMKTANKKGQKGGRCWRICTDMLLYSQPCVFKRMIPTLFKTNELKKALR